MRSVAPQSSQLRAHLQNLARVLEEAGEHGFAAKFARALAGTDRHFYEFLESNEMWGGAGSVADSAGFGCQRADRRRIEGAMIQLGTEQIRVGKVNPRTQMWVDAFTEWEKQGL